MLMLGTIRAMLYLGQHDEALICYDRAIAKANKLASLSSLGKTLSVAEKISR
jgi:hypothetical protein